MKSRGENPFRKVLVKIGHQLTAFKAQMMAKLEVEMARELAMVPRARTANIRKPMRSSGQQSDEPVMQSGVRSGYTA